jgi:hypothetical protein
MLTKMTDADWKGGVTNAPDDLNDPLRTGYALAMSDFP